MEVYMEDAIKIVGGIANIARSVNKNLELRELAAILNLFGQMTSEGREYANPGRLVIKAKDEYTRIGDTTTADNITLVFGNIDVSLL